MKLCGSEEHQIWASIVARVVGGASQGMDEKPSDTEIVEVVSIAAKIGDAVIAEFRKRDNSKP